MKEIKRRKKMLSLLVRPRARPRTRLLLAAKANSTALFDAILLYRPCPSGQCGSRGCEAMRAVLNKIEKEAGVKLP